MTLQQLQSVAEVARAGSISEAARRLFLSQSRLSESVRALEEELGVQIFERSNRGIVTTPRGRSFWPVPARCWRAAGSFRKNIRRDRIGGIGKADGRTWPEWLDISRRMPYTPINIYSYYGSREKGE